MPQLRLLMAGTCAFFALTAHADTRDRRAEERWYAYSTTALSITGDILLSPTRLKADGHDFPLRAAADLPVYDTSLLEHVSARVFQVTRQTNPILLNGNTLGCGGPVRWMVVYRLEHGKMLGIDVFDGPVAPTTASTDPGACATYVYVAH